MKERTSFSREDHARLHGYATFELGDGELCPREISTGHDERPEVKWIKPVDVPQLTGPFLDRNGRDETAEVDSLMYGAVSMRRWTLENVSKANKGIDITHTSFMAHISGS